MFSPFVIKKIFFRPRGLLNSSHKNSGVLRSVHFWTGESCSMGKVNQSNFGLIESWVGVKVDAAKIGDIKLFAASKSSNVVHDIRGRNQLKIEPIKFSRMLKHSFR